MALIPRFYGNAYQPTETQRVPRKRSTTNDKPLWHVRASPGQLWKAKNAYVSGVRITKYS
jgi:hypothetical protein